MKTLNDYMTDPRILDDEEMMSTPEPVREVHAARLKIHDETAGMSAAERNAYYQKKSANFFDKLLLFTAAKRCLSIVGLCVP